MPINPNFLERLMLFRLNGGPAPILDLFGAAGFESMALALELGLFETLANDGALSADDLANRIGTHPDGTARLCEFLVATRYLSKSDDRYRLSGMTDRWLLGDSEADMGPFFTFWNELVFPFWEQELETAVTEGTPNQTLYDWCNEKPGRWAVAQAGFRSAAELLAEDLSAAIAVPEGAERVIDVGGGHGLYSFELCRRYPELSATIFDLHGAVEVVTVPDDLAGRVDTAVGDYRTDELGKGFDLALLFNVVHAQDTVENTALIKRVADTLAPGGRIFLLDQWSGSGRTPISRAYLQFIALTYLTTLDADIYNLNQVTSWLREAGFGQVRTKNIGPLSGQAMVEATKVT